MGASESGREITTGVVMSDMRGILLGVADALPAFLPGIVTSETEE